MRVTKLSGFQRSGSEMLNFLKLKKYNKLVKNYFQMKFENEDLIYQLRGIQNAIKWVVLLIPLKDMVFGKILRLTSQVYSTSLWTNYTALQQDGSKTVVGF